MEDEGICVKSDENMSVAVLSQCTERADAGEIEDSVQNISALQLISQVANPKSSREPKSTHSGVKNIQMGAAGDSKGRRSYRKYQDSHTKYLYGN